MQGTGSTIVSETDATMIPMIESRHTEILATEMSETYETHAMRTIAIERETTEIHETETYGIRGTFETGTTETREMHETLETSEIAESPTCPNDRATDGLTRDLTLALVLDPREGHRLPQCPRRRSS
jgi:hypothetical protein